MSSSERMAALLLAIAFMEKTDVLVVGAGPTGLVLALWLTHFGARVRIVDKAAAPGQTSRAIGVQARTLELYRQLDLAEPLVAAGVASRGLNVWVRGKHEGRLDLASMGAGLSPFPYLLVYPQEEHEALLVSRLADAGVHVERSSELLDFVERDHRIVARIRRGDGGLDTVEADYLAGCDGARSWVREALKIGFPGGTYEHLFYVADVEASGPTMNGEAHFAFDDDGDFIANLALHGTSQARLIGTVRRDLREGDTLGWDDVDKTVIGRIGLHVERVNWFSTYRVHHRVASSFHVGRAFLLGDAAHIHSPVGGQGMNTGIGDAVNLAWKLAMVLDGRAPSTLLDSYDEERIPFARRLVHTTDRVFELIASGSAIARLIRAEVTPRLLTMLSRSRAFRRFLFRTVSQINVNYRSMSLSEGRVGRVRGGDRLPWVAFEGGADNFDALRSLDWQVHVYGEPAAALRSTCEARGIPVHAFPFDRAAARGGLVRDAAYLVRPDGYVALTTTNGVGIDHLIERYFDTRGLHVGHAHTRLAA